MKQEDANDVVTLLRTLQQVQSQAQTVSMLPQIPYSLAGMAILVRDRAELSFNQIAYHSGVIIHALQHGHAVCGRAGVPATWGPLEFWENDLSLLTCAVCKRRWAALQAFQATTTEHAQQTQG